MKHMLLILGVVAILWGCKGSSCGDSGTRPRPGKFIGVVQDFQYTPVSDDNTAITITLDGGKKIGIVNWNLPDIAVGDSVYKRQGRFKWY